MKKLLNISVIAALAILPLAANAEVVAVADPAHDDNAAAAQTLPKYALAEANANVDGVVATAGYVKGAYNAAIMAINNVAETANGAVKSVTEGATNGTIKVDDTEVAVHGLGSAAFANTNAFDAAGAAAGVKADIEGKLDDGANGYDINAKTLKVQGANVLTDAALTDYATKTGVVTTVTNALNNATAAITSANVTTGNAVSSATVPVVTTWGATEPATTGVSVDLTQTAVVTNVSGTAAVTPGTVQYPAN